MKHQLIHSEGSSRLLLIFAGWGMDPGVFSNISRPGYDLMVVWDYRSLEFDHSILASYSEVCLLAWSMGVFAASRVLAPSDSKISLRIAVNGTLSPIDDNLGIPENVYYSTLENLSEKSLQKFFRRMSYGKEDRSLFESLMPRRDIVELADELRAVAEAAKVQPDCDFRWDLAVVGLNDLIFPPANQQKAWTQKDVRMRTLDRGHFFDFSLLTNHYFIDKASASSHFETSLSTYSDNAGVQSEVVKTIVSLLKTHGIDTQLKEGPRIIEIGSGSGLLSREIGRLSKGAKITFLDFASPFPPDLPEGNSYFHRKCDAEVDISNFEKSSVDFIFSSSTIQWFNSPEKFLLECRKILKPGGLAVISTFVEGNLREISELTGLALPMLSSEEWHDMVSRHFTILAQENFEHIMVFDYPIEVLRHLKNTGVNSLGGTDSNRNALELIRRYPGSADGRYRLTYTPAIFILEA